jgi:hypothetical protein
MRIVLIKANDYVPTAREPGEQCNEAIVDSSGGRLGFTAQRLRIARISSRFSGLVPGDYQRPRERLAL